MHVDTLQVEIVRLGDAQSSVQIDSHPWICTEPDVTEAIETDGFIAGGPRYQIDSTSVCEQRNDRVDGRVCPWSTSRAIDCEPLVEVLSSGTIRNAEEAEAHYHAKQRLPALAEYRILLEGPIRVGLFNLE